MGDACCLGRLGLLYGLLLVDVLPEDGFGLANVADAGGRPECGGDDFLEGDVAMSEVPERPAPVSVAEDGADVAFLTASS